MAIHWQTRFKSLRAGTTYTVNIYDDAYTGTPVELDGAAEPLVTEEEDDEDFFKPVRTQSGYLRIIDQGGTFNWRSMIPATDTSRPVTVTDDTGAVCWQGFLQAQNFSGRLYETPQVREFPLHCAMSVLSRIDAEPDAFTGSVSFAALLDYILNAIPTLTFSAINIQGGSDARTWLMKKFDWAMMSEMNDEDVFESSYDLLDLLENMCAYWGWSVRTFGQEIYLLAPDDSTCINMLKLTRQELTALAGGTVTGTIAVEGFPSVTVGDVFASMENEDTQMRGHNQAIVTARVQTVDEDVLECFPESVMKQMYDRGFQDDQHAVIEGKYTTYKYTTDLYTFTSTMLKGWTGDGGSFNIAMITESELRPAVRIHKAYNNGYCYAYLDTMRVRNFTDGEIQLRGSAYYRGAKFEETWNDNSSMGKRNMRMRLGIGMTEATAKWWNGSAWVSGGATPPEFYAKIGGTDGIFWTTQYPDAAVGAYSAIPTGPSSLEGYIFVRFLGSDDINDKAEYCNFDVSDFEICFSRPNDAWRVFDSDRRDENEYKAKNNAMVKSVWSYDLLFATDNYCVYGPNVVLNAAGGYFPGWDYANHREATSVANSQNGYGAIDLGKATVPEQHIANRVAKFWSQSRRKIDAELQSHLVGGIKPQSKVVIDGTTLYPLAISREWRDDVLKVMAIEI